MVKIFKKLGRRSPLIFSDEIRQFVKELIKNKSIAISWKENDATRADMTRRVW